VVTAVTVVDAEAGAVTGAGAEALADDLAAEVVATAELRTELAELRTELAEDLTEEALADAWAEVTATAELRTELAELRTELAEDLTEEALADPLAEVPAAMELRTELAELTIDEATELAAVGEVAAEAPGEVPAGTELLWVPRDGPGIGLTTVAEPVAEAGTVVGTVAEATLLTETGVEDEEELELEAGQLRSKRGVLERV